MKRSARFPVSATLLRRLAFANIVANAGIVVTGGAVRLTASGLGCPTWPRCTDESYTTTAEMGVHGAIEFGNRLLTFVAGADRGRHPAGRAGPPAAPTGRGAARAGRGVRHHRPGRDRRDHRTAPNCTPRSWASTSWSRWLLLLVAYALWRRVAEPDGPKVPLVPPALRALTWSTVVVSAAVIVVGVAVTGSGPHAGDADAIRNGLDPQTISQIHADLVFLLVGLTVGLWLALHAVGAPASAVRAARTLLLVELAQGVIGFVQYFTNLPVLLVGAHMLGSCLVWLATLSVLWSIRERRPADAPTRAAAPVAAAEEPVPA